MCSYDFFYGATCCAYAPSIFEGRINRCPSSAGRSNLPCVRSQAFVELIDFRVRTISSGDEILVSIAKRLSLELLKIFQTTKPIRNFL